MRSKQILTLARDGGSGGLNPHGEVAAPGLQEPLPVCQLTGVGAGIPVSSRLTHSFPYALSKLLTFNQLFKWWRNNFYSLQQIWQ